MSYRIAVLVGSLRAGSHNKALADAVTALGPDDMTFESVTIGDLPPYNQDEEQDAGAAVRRLKDAIRSADGVLFATPEYNRSVPGVLKNAIDHASRPYGESVWRGKPAGVIGASVGAPGSSMAQQHLRNVLAYLDMPTLGQPEIFLQVKEGTFDERGQIPSKDTKALLQGWMDRYVAWVKAHASK